MKLQFLDLAKKESSKSDHPQHKMGAVLIYKNKLISSGYNKMKTHPKVTNEFPFIHCEFDAIIKAPKKYLKGSEIYVYRIRRSNTPGCSKPCPDCLKLIKEKGIKVIYYTTGDDKFVETIYL